ncbi:hypothetical protein IPH92_01130 [Candidatus Kaiserbacteria bacterium]|nr:MAG: hypothetical protein IPH92_01130 [Candidatus Kaiserbacteria bacterium]
MRAFSIALNSIRAFFGIENGDDYKKVCRKIVFVGFKRFMYVILDYWLAGITAAANLFLKAYEVDIVLAFMAMLLLNMTICIVFVMTYEKTGVDLSLGVDLRRAVDKIHTESKTAGYFAILIVSIQAIFWSGPEQIVIFFQKELPGWKRWVALLVLTAIQTVIWMFLWRTGYDVISGG